MDREERQKAQLREQELQKRSLMRRQEMAKRKQSAGKEAKTILIYVENTIFIIESFEP